MKTPKKTKFDIAMDKRVKKFFCKLQPKHAGQLKTKLLSLQDNPYPQDSKKLHAGGYRVTAGEYRILYTVDNDHKVVTVFEIAKRNDYKY